MNERAKKGTFLSFQNPLEIPGVTLSSFIRSALEQKAGSRLRPRDFKRQFKNTMTLLNMNESYAERDLNAGFSGGEKKKAEILQMLILKPKPAFWTRPTLLWTWTRSTPSARVSTSSGSGLTVHTLALIPVILSLVSGFAFLGATRCRPG